VFPHLSIIFVIPAVIGAQAFHAPAAATNLLVTPGDY